MSSKERLGPKSKLNILDILENIFEQTVSVEAYPDDILEPLPCAGCQNLTSKAFVDYEWDWQSRGGKVRVTFAKGLLGYRCGGCGVEYYDGRLSYLFLEQVAEALSKMGDDFLKEELRRDSADPRTYTAFSPIPPQVKESLRRLNAALNLEASRD